MTICLERADVKVAVANVFLIFSLGFTGCADDLVESPSDELAEGVFAEGTQSDDSPSSASEKMTYNSHFLRDRSFERPIGVVRWTEATEMKPGGKRWEEWHNRNNHVWKLNTGYTKSLLPPVVTRTMGRAIYAEGNTASRSYKIKSHSQGVNVELGINTFEDFGHSRPPEKADGSIAHYWPHMILDQNLAEEGRLKVENLGEVRVRMNVQLLHTDRAIHSHPTAQTGHFLFYFYVQNSSGRGFWIGSDLYDARNHRSGHYPTETFTPTTDSNTDDPVFSLRGRGIPTAALYQIMAGRAVSLDFDVHPFMVRALEHMRSKGLIAESEKSKFWVSHFNIGWEAPGLFNGLMRIENLRIDLQPVKSIVVHRYRNVAHDDYLYTTDKREVAGRSDWQYEGEAFSLFSGALGPELYRCRRRNNKHFLSANPECEGQIFEGSLGHGYARGVTLRAPNGRGNSVVNYQNNRSQFGLSLYRCYSPQRDVHLSTTIPDECVKGGFRNEGVTLAVH